MEDRHWLWVLDQSLIIIGKQTLVSLEIFKTLASSIPLRETSPLERNFVSVTEIHRSFGSMMPMDHRSQIVRSPTPLILTLIETTWSKILYLHDSRWFTSSNTSLVAVQEVSLRCTESAMEKSMHHYIYKGLLDTIQISSEDQWGWSMCIH